MPDIELQHVVSFSSADKNNPAENLLKSDGTHKWRSAAAGEKSLSCVLQFSKSSQINSVDIGNEGSAFVEVLVGKATASDDQDFEVLLVASSFMSPIDSRNGTNRNSVRLFGPDLLNKATASQKWDRVKIVCTQPFAKTSQYGLSFIRFHSPPGSGDGGGETKVKKLGAFTFNDPDEDDDANIRTGSLFANRSKTNSSPVPASSSAPTGAAAVRLASKQAEQKLQTSATSSPSRKRHSSPPAAGSKAKAAKTDRKAVNDDSDTEEDEPANDKPALRKQSTSISSVASSAAASDKGEKSTALKRSKTMPSSESSTKVFSKLMEEVVFVLSGFQNPYRGELRDKALEMGAKYRPDWGRGCTHLICAFQNTPKYQQVAGKGKIVTKSWILDSHKQKKLLPWRKYRLGDADSPSGSEEDSEEEERVRKQNKTPSRRKSPSRTTPAKQSQKGTSKKGVAFDDDSDSGGDTEEDTRKAAERDAKKKAPATTANAQARADKNRDDRGAQGDPYDVSTDEEADAAADNGSDSGLPDLPEFFSDKHFFFYGDFESSQQRLLTRYIAAYNGEVEDYMSKKVNYVVTSQAWDDNFEEALSENPNLVFVKPKWIFACHEKNKMVPYQAYIVVPK